MNKKLSLSAVIFDFDGTLAKLNIDFPLMRKGIIDLIKEYDISLDGLGNLFILETIEAAGKAISLKNPGDEKKFLQEASDLIEQIEIKAAKDGELFEGTREMLKEFKIRNIKTGIVTRNCRPAVMIVFPDVYQYFDSILTREMTKRVKPDPEHLLHSLRELLVSPEVTSMVGDHPMDIKIGQAVGVFTVGVLTGYSSKKELFDSKADLIIDKAKDLLDFLQ